MQYLIYVACLLAGLALGVLAGWLFGSAGSLAAERETAALRAQLADRDRAQEEKQKEVELAQQRLRDSFKALAADALNANNRSFLDLAKAVLETTQK
jgi:DNA recombination protein RmuC